MKGFGEEGVKEAGCMDGGWCVELHCVKEVGFAVLVGQMVVGEGVRAEMKYAVAEMKCFVRMKNVKTHGNIGDVKAQTTSNEVM